MSVGARAEIIEDSIEITQIGRSNLHKYLPKQFVLSIHIPIKPGRFEFAA